MTLTERVLRHLEETRGQWELLPYHGGSRLLPRIRKWTEVRFRSCPIESMTGRCPHYGNCSLYEKQIMLAADGANGFDPALRAAMLEAARLTKGGDDEA